MKNSAVQKVNTGHYVGGEWQHADSNSMIDVEDPRTGKIIAQVSDTFHDQWSQALKSALKADFPYRKSSIGERVQLLDETVRLIEESRDDLAQIISAESGKALSEADAEVNYGVGFFQTYSSVIQSERDESTRALTGEYEMLAVQEAVGPALLITPWNFPFAMVARKVAAALAAGCVSILKPAAQTPLTAAFVVDLLHEAGAPKGTVAYLPTSNAGKLSEFFLAEPRIRKVSFTGSTGVGRVLNGLASKNFQAVSMELGGNAPFLVLPSADIDKAVEGAMVAKFRNSGQACVAANRIIVHSAVADEFVEKLRVQVGKMNLSFEGREPDMGPMISQTQLDNFQELVDKSKEEGGQVIAGGNCVEGPGYFFEPTVVTGLDRNATIWQEEIFGPLAGVFVADSIDEMIEWANDTEYGLAAYAYSNDLSEVTLLQESIDSGMLAINRPIVADARAPFGGVKFSGFGREGGNFGLDDYRVTKYVTKLV